jgi:prephenate dehydrogenase
MKPLFNTVAIVGVGLIGGSLAAALRARQRGGTLVGLGRNAATVQRALDLGLVDVAGTDPTLLAQADLVVLAIPVAQTAATLAAILPHLKPGALISDAGSTKQDVVAAATSVLAPVDRLACFIPAHPIAGKESNGPEAADASLYENRHVVITPLAENVPADVARIQALWEAVGAKVSIMAPADHDAVFAAVSHLPHLLAYALVAQIAESSDGPRKLAFAGGGFRDFTRIAASSPEMWRDIFLANRDAVLAELADYQTMLTQTRALLASGDGQAIEQWLASAAQVRQNWQPGVGPASSRAPSPCPLPQGEDSNP